MNNQSTLDSCVHMLLRSKILACHSSFTPVSKTEYTITDGTTTVELHLVEQQVTVLTPPYYDLTYKLYVFEDYDYALACMDVSSCNELDLLRLNVLVTTVPFLSSNLFGCPDYYYTATLLPSSEHDIESKTIEILRSSDTVFCGETRAFSKLGSNFTILYYLDNRHIIDTLGGAYFGCLLDIFKTSKIDFEKYLYIIIVDNLVSIITLANNGVTSSTVHASTRLNNYIPEREVVE